MVDILHRVGVQAPADQVYAALTAPERLAAWWTGDTRSSGDVLEFRFTSGGFDMKILERTPDERVHWEVIGGPDEWIGTHVTFDLDRAGDYTIVLFKHEGWKEPVEFMHHCSTKWATYLMSLKQLVETGKGAPNPHDVKIDDWG